MKNEFLDRLATVLLFVGKYSLIGLVSAILIMFIILTKGLALLLFAVFGGYMWAEERVYNKKKRYPDYL